MLSNQIKLIGISLGRERESIPYLANSTKFFIHETADLLNQKENQEISPLTKISQK